MTETADAPAMKRYQLLVPCHIDGQLRQAGYVTTKPADWDGPKRTRVSQHEQIHVGEDSTRIPLTGEDEKLYVELKDDADARHVAQAAQLDHDIAHAEAHLADLRAQRAAKDPT